MGGHHVWSLLALSLVWCGCVATRSSSEEDERPEPQCVPGSVQECSESCDATAACIYDGDCSPETRLCGDDALWQPCSCASMCIDPSRVAEATTLPGTASAEFPRPDREGRRGGFDGPLRLALRTMYIEFEDTAGEVAPSTGFDIDGQLSVGALAHCDSPAVGPCDPRSRLLDDGPGGIDNAFGRFVAHNWIGLNPVEETRKAFRRGEIGLLLELLPSGPNEMSLDLSWGVATIEPEWQGDDLWNRTEDQHRVSFDAAPFVAGVWAGRVEGPLLLPLVSFGGLTVLQLDSPRLVVRLEPGRIFGTLAGSTQVQSFDRWLRDAVSPVVDCVDGFVNESLRVFSADLAGDESNGDSNLPCERVSFAIDFEASPIAGIGEAVPTPNVVNCEEPAP